MACESLPFVTSTDFGSRSDNPCKRFLIHTQNNSPLATVMARDGATHSLWNAIMGSIRDARLSFSPISRLSKKNNARTCRYILAMRYFRASQSHMSEGTVQSGRAIERQPFFLRYAHSGLVTAVAG